MILFAPTPPELVFAFTPGQMARLDRRFARLDALPADPTLLMQDSALLLNAFITLKVGKREWAGRPDHAFNFPQLTEPEWEEQLGLHAMSAQQVKRGHLAELLGWSSGVVYIFAGQLLRHYHLSDDLDRLELEFLWQDGWPGVHILRAHQLAEDGSLTLWRAELTV